MTIRFDLRHARPTRFIVPTSLFRDGIEITPDDDGSLGLVEQEEIGQLPQLYFQGELQTDCDLYVDGELRARIRPETTEMFDAAPNPAGDYPVLGWKPDPDWIKR